jgi:hypothetical protein
MKLSLPQSDQALLRVTAKAGNWSKKVCVGRPFTYCEIVIDEGIDERDVEVVAEPCNRKGEVVESVVVLKAAVKAKTTEVKAQTKPQPRPSLEPKPKKKRVKRGQEIAPPKSADLDSTRSQAGTVNDERDTGRTECNDSRWSQESHSDNVL